MREKRDPAFDKKMEAAAAAEVLIVYKEVNLQNELNAAAAGRHSAAEEKYIITLSVDEKPGVQAIRNIAPDLPPKADKSKTWSRDYRGEP